LKAAIEATVSGRIARLILAAAADAGADPAEVARAAVYDAAGAARFPIGGGRSLRLVEEGGAWRVDALE